MPRFSAKHVRRSRALRNSFMRRKTDAYAYCARYIPDARLRTHGGLKRLLDGTDNLGAASSSKVRDTARADAANPPTSPLTDRSPGELYPPSNKGEPMPNYRVLVNEN